MRTASLSYLGPSFIYFVLHNGILSGRLGRGDGGGVMERGDRRRGDWGGKVRGGDTGGVIGKGDGERMIGKE